MATVAIACKHPSSPASQRGWYHPRHPGIVGLLLAGLLTFLYAPAGTASSVAVYQDTPEIAPLFTALCEGPDGKVWLAGEGGLLATVSTDGGFTNWSIAGTLSSLTPGPDGAVWGVDWQDGALVRYSTTGAAIAYPAPITTFLSNHAAEGIAVGSDHNLWCVADQAIARVAQDGTWTSFSLGTLIADAITAGPDGNCWFIASLSTIGRITPSGTITTWPLPAFTWANQLVAGPDGNLWFTDQGNGAIGRCTTAGVVQEWAIADGAMPQGITVGPDGNLWFTDDADATVGRCTTGGVITEFGPLGLTLGQSLVTGADHRLWVQGQTVFGVFAVDLTALGVSLTGGTSTASASGTGAASATAGATTGVLATGGGGGGGGGGGCGFGGGAAVVLLGALVAGRQRIRERRRVSSPARLASPP